MWYNNSDKSRRPDRSLFSSWPILQKEQKMNRKEKFKQGFKIITPNCSRAAEIYNKRLVFYTCFFKSEQNGVITF